MSDFNSRMQGFVSTSHILSTINHYESLSANLGVRFTFALIYNVPIKGARELLVG